MPIQSKESLGVLRVEVQTVLDSPEKPTAFHVGRPEDNLNYLRIASILDKRIDLLKQILNPPKSVQCFSPACFGPHAIERAA